MAQMDQNRMLSFFKIKALPSVQSARSGDINQLKLLLMLLQKNVTETSPHHKVDNSVFNRTDLEAVRAVSGPRTIVCSCLCVVTAAAVVTHSRTTDTQTTD